MKQNKIFKIISSLMILLTILAVVNATTISNSLSTFTNNIDMGTKELYNATNINATNFYANGVLLKPDTNNFPLSIQVTGTTSKTLNLERNGTTNITAGFTDIDTDTWYNVTSVQVTGTGTKTLNVEQLGGIANRTASFTDIDTDTVFNTTSIQVTGTTTKTLNLEQIGIANRTASWTDIDTDVWTNTTNNLTYTSGNVGIGLTTPTTRLSLLATEITSPAEGTPILTLDTSDKNGGDGGAIINFLHGGQATAFIKSSSGLATTNPYISFGTSTNTSTPIERIRINENGSIGIGTTSPSVKLEVKMTNTNDYISLFNDGSSGSQESSIVWKNGASYKYASSISSQPGTNYDSGDLRFNTATTGTLATKMLITNTGNVGINTTTPSEKLAIVGNINMTGNLTVDLGSGIKLNQSQTYMNIIQNSSGCVVIKGASSTLAVC